MKKIFLPFILSILAVSLGHAQGMEMFDKFHDYFAKRNWNKLEKLLSDDFQLIDYNGEVVDNKTNYINFLKNWSGTINTTWKVFKAKEQNGYVFSTEQDWDLFNNTFYGIPPTFSFRYEFTDTQIRKLTYDTLPGHHIFEQKFAKNYSTFITWVVENKKDESNSLSDPDFKKMAKAFIKLITLFNKSK